MGRRVVSTNYGWKGHHCRGCRPPSPSRLSLLSSCSLPPPDVDIEKKAIFPNIMEMRWVKGPASGLTGPFLNRPLDGHAPRPHRFLSGAGRPHPAKLPPTCPAHRIAKYEQWLNLKEQMGLAGLELVRWEDMLTPQEQVCARQVASRPAAAPVSPPPWKMQRASRLLGPCGGLPRFKCPPLLWATVWVAPHWAGTRANPPAPAAAAHSWPGSDRWRSATPSPSRPT